MSKTPLTIVFDLDGTLAHTSPDIAAALNAALAPHGSQVTLAQTERMVGGGLRTLLDKALTLAALDLPDDARDETYAALLHHYRAAPAERTVLHGWVADTMIHFRRQGARIAICSNKPHDLVLAIIDALGIGQNVHAAIGHMPDRPKKPDPEPLRVAIEMAGGKPERALMVGDSGADVGAARALGVPVILVPHGYGERSIGELGADRIVSTAKELRDSVRQLTSRKSV